MTHSTHSFVPVFTSEAGLCLTPANWQEVSISKASYHLEELLIKPGLAVLYQISNLKQYLGWSGTLILNASRLTANKAGICTIISSYDGSTLRMTHVELIKIIQHLKPDLVLLPKNLIQNYRENWLGWDESILPIISADELSQQKIPIAHGVYLSPGDHFIEQLDKWPDLIRYVCGDVDLDGMRQLKNKSIEYIESDMPATDAIKGVVYSNDGGVHLLDKLAEQQFEPIASDCHCPPCKQGLTKAYLHHLLLHTPLLCHRFLIQHNIHQMQSQV